MKHEKHPIDDLFQRGLSQHAVPPPMHVWERIEESRGSRHRSKLVFVRQKFTLLAGAAAVLLLGVWLYWLETPELGSFPLAGQAAGSAEPLAAMPDAALALPPQEAGLLPDVKALITSKKAADAPAPAKPVGVVQQVITKAAPAVVQGQALSPAPEAPPAFSVQGATPAHIAAKAVPGPAAPDLLQRAAVKALPGALTNLEAKPLPMPETGCARFSEGRPALFLALTAEPSLAMRDFTAKDEEHVAYAGQRTETERMRLSYGAGARLSVVFPWGGAIRSGLSYTQINEQLVYRNSRVRQTTITEIYGPNGEVIGRDTTYITENTVLKYNNRHRLIDIPIQLGYEVRYNKLTVAANAGLQLNVAYRQEGSYLGPRDLLPTRFNSSDPDAEPIYKTRLGLGWQASLGLHYQLNSRLDLMAEPYLRYYPQSFTRPDYPLDQQYLIGGLGLGLRVLL